MPHAWQPARPRSAEVYQQVTGFQCCVGEIRPELIHTFDWLNPTVPSTPSSAGVRRVKSSTRPSRRFVVGSLWLHLHSWRLKPRVTGCSGMSEPSQWCHVKILVGPQRVNCWKARRRGGASASILSGRHACNKAGNSRRRAECLRNYMEAMMVRNESVGDS